MSYGWEESTLEPYFTFVLVVGFSIVGLWIMDEELRREDNLVTSQISAKIQLHVSNISDLRLLSP